MITVVKCYKHNVKPLVIEVFEGHDEQTQKEIAKDLKISRSYVSRIEKRALVKLYREFLKNNKI